MEAISTAADDFGPGRADTPCRALLVDGDPNFCSLLQEYLSTYSFHFTVAHDGLSALKAMDGAEYDIIILDMLLPDMHGLEVLKYLRRRIPVVVLSEQDEETDRIVALELGADDYMAKRYSPRELLARIRAVLRRSAVSALRPEDMANLVRGDLVINSLGREVCVNGELLPITHIEFKLLYHMAREPGRVFSREQLFSGITGRNFYICDRSIDMHVSSLRRKLGDDSRSPRYVKTIRGVGYSFIRQG